MLRFGSLTVNVSADSLLFFHCCCYCKFSINSQAMGVWFVEFTWMSSYCQIVRLDDRAFTVAGHLHV